MAELSVKDVGKKAEMELPPPPLLDSAPHPTEAESQEELFMPLPPPKESFSKFYEQRQVNELKRLYRHMHPELRKNLEHSVNSEISDLLKPDDPCQQAPVSLDTSLTGEVQSMRWIFENWNLDAIGEHQGSKKLTEEETVLGGNVKDTSMRFQGQINVGSDNLESIGKDQSKGDVKTALWLFETQPLDSMNKIYPADADVHEVVLKESIERGDVKGTKFLFETCSLDEVGRCNSVEEHNILQLKSEIQELKGDVKKTVKLFQTEPLCAIRDNSGNIHKIKNVCREETESNQVNTTRWLFETQPLDTIHKDSINVQIIRGISLEDIEKGGVNATKWIFETQPLDTIKELTDEMCFQASSDTHDKDRSSKVNTTDEALAGDVKSTLWLFETQPMGTLKGNFEVGQLKRVTLLNEEKGDVKQRKQIFETRSMDRISNGDEEADKNQSLINTEILKGDVKSFKNLFETLPLDSVKRKSSVVVSNQENIQGGSVKANQTLFETVPLYAIEDSLGNFHEVTSVSREQVERGNVKNYQWMFETKPLDQFNDSPQKVDVIRGITKQEIVSGNVGTAKWLFETQPIDVIHQESNSTEKHSSVQKEVLQRGDVKKCRWLFETQPMDRLCDNSEQKKEEDTPLQGDVKSYTWMFETQTLDSIRDAEERYINVRTTSQDSSQVVDVKTTKNLFETEPLDNVSSTRKVMRYSSRIEIPSGEVSRVKEIFEIKPKEETCAKNAHIPQEENIEKGSVNKFTWLFENCPLDSMKTRAEGFQEMPNEKDVQGGDVVGKKFVFETYSLDQIHQDMDETEIKKIQESITRGDVKSCTMLFETKPLYAIQDKGGEYHEVTSVQKEEVLKDNVRGAKWLFETKPLDKINKDEEVFIIRAVTQEDIEKGCVKAARWRFETEPLDYMAEEAKPIRKELDDVQKGDVHFNKQLFESQQLNQKKYVRLVSVSDVQKGNVRTSSWLFENQPIDSLKGESEEHPGIIKVQRQDNQRGDVKRCTWLFESQPLDSLRDAETPVANLDKEVVPQANVRSTTWLFERTPLDKFERTSSLEENEINVKYTLDHFLSSKIIEHQGIVIENVDGINVKMVKYQPVQTTAEIQKEEVLAGNMQRILLQLLHRADIQPHGLLVEEDTKGELLKTNVQLLLFEEQGQDKERLVQDNLNKAFQILLNKDEFVKTGILMEEKEGGSVKIIIFSVSKYLKSSFDKESAVKGDVKSTIGNLLACSQQSKRKISVTREQNEKGNVQLYTSCIEKGDLGYLRSLQDESEIEALALSQSDNEKPANQNAKRFCEQQNSGNMTESQSVMGKKCVYRASESTVPWVQPGDESSVFADSTTTKPLSPPKNHCQLQKNTTQQEERTATHFAACREEGSHIKQTTSGTLSNECNDLQTALLDLRQATADAKSIQKQVQGKFQRGRDEVQSSHEQIKRKEEALIQSKTHFQEAANVKQSARTSSLLVEPQKLGSTSATSTKKVSAQEKDSQRQLLLEAGQELFNSAESSYEDGVDSSKHLRKYLNPFITSEYMIESVSEVREQEIVRGDVKGAIRALQNASSEQRDIEKEEVVRGNLTTALQSLEKSNVNVSKGDFKTAMIYRNAGKPHSVSKTDKELRCQAAVKGIPQFDNDFHPSSAAVSGHDGHQPPQPSKGDDSTELVHLTPVIPDSDVEEASERTLDENANTLPAFQTLKTQRKKPVPPPKPKHLLPGTYHPPLQSSKTQMMSALPDNASNMNASTFNKEQPHRNDKPSAPVDVAEQDTDIYKANQICQGKMDTCRKLNSESSKQSISKLDEPIDFQTQALENSTATYLGLKSDITSQNRETQEFVQSKKGVTVTNPNQSLQNNENQVVMRVKQKRETEDEKRKRLSIHMDEIMKGNIRASMDIFDNLRKQDELQLFLNKVQELEEETSAVNVKSMKGLFESVPDWVAKSPDGKNDKDESSDLLKDDTESVSSVELAFEDLEKASSEIKHLKEQTLARLLDIEETIKKALYSVSSLKSESDIIGLSGLFRESLGTSANMSSGNNIRKISIVSSKFKPEKPTHLPVQKSVEAVAGQQVQENKRMELDVTNVSNRAISPASPSFITIESAARKPQNANTLEKAQNSKSLKNGRLPEGVLTRTSPCTEESTGQYHQIASVCDSGAICHNNLNSSEKTGSVEQNAHSNVCSQTSPLNPQRQKSILEVKTGPESPKLIGTTIVTEKYEESDQYGNKIIRSKTSTTVTKQSDTQSSSTYEVVSALPRYSVTKSPLLRRHGIPTIESSNSRANETGVVFVTFGNSNGARK